jgi:hypothetical protein
VRSAIGSVESFLCKNAGAGEIEENRDVCWHIERQVIKQTFASSLGTITRTSKRFLLCNPDNAFMSIYDAASAITGQILENPNPEISADSWVFRHFLSQTRICGMWHDGKLYPYQNKLLCWRVKDSWARENNSKPVPFGSFGCEARLIIAMMQLLKRAIYGDESKIHDIYL